MNNKNVAIVIPARLDSQRLNKKAIQIIGSKPMIAHVWERAMEANVGPVYVATDHQDIVDIIQNIGGTAILTPSNLASGTDRVFHILKNINHSFDKIINLQGDLPFIPASLLKDSLHSLDHPQADIGTIARKVTCSNEKQLPNKVKTSIAFYQQNQGKALYFTRAPIPYNNNAFYEHIGLYIYRTQALKQFVETPQSTLEKIEKLEQLRALENNMRIDVRLTQHHVLGVDTPEDLKQANKILS